MKITQQIELEYSKIEKNILFIYLGGSRLFNLSSVVSDYDIVFFKKNKTPALDINNIKTNNGQLVHFIETDIDRFFNPISYFDLICLISFIFLARDTSKIYDIKNNLFLDYCLKHSKLLFKIGSYLLYDFFNLKEPIHKKEIPSNLNNKYIYMVILIKQELFNEELDINYLKQVKQEPYIIWPSSIKEKVIQDIVQLRNYIEGNLFDAKKELNQLKNEWNIINNKPS